MTAYEKAQKKLRSQPRTWLVTGAAGFIGSHLVEKLLSLNQEVVGLDNFSTGSKGNLAEVRTIVGPAAWKNFRFIKGDIRDLNTCKRACKQVDYVLHQAALGSVPRSIDDPITSNESNVTGSLNMLVAARDAKVKRFVYASSSAVYGDEPGLPKVEEKIGKPLSPYAVTKYTNELYADVFARCYGLETVGLRYFNVFGPRQDPNGPYAAVIPKWIAAMRNGEDIYINGDGETSRDFCYVANVVQANILAATTAGVTTRVFNVACKERTTLNELFQVLRATLRPEYPRLRDARPKYHPFRSGDIRHSLAEISEAVEQIGYEPLYRLGDAMATMVENGRARRKARDHSPARNGI